MTYLSPSIAQYNKSLKRWFKELAMDEDKYTLSFLLKEFEKMGGESSMSGSAIKLELDNCTFKLYPHDVNQVSFKIRDYMVISSAGPHYINSLISVFRTINPVFIIYTLCQYFKYFDKLYTILSTQGDSKYKIKDINIKTDRFNNNMYVCYELNNDMCCLFHFYNFSDNFLRPHDEMYCAFKHLFLDSCDDIKNTNTNTFYKLDIDNVIESLNKCYIESAKKDPKVFKELVASTFENREMLDIIDSL